MTQEQNRLLRSRRQENMSKLNHMFSRSLKNNRSKNLNRRKGRLNFKYKADPWLAAEAEKGEQETQKKRLKDIILKNRRMFKINKVKRYGTEGNQMANNILRNIQHRLRDRNHFQFQKDVLEMG